MKRKTSESEIKRPAEVKRNKQTNKKINNIEGEKKRPVEVKINGQRKRRGMTCESEKEWQVKVKKKEPNDSGSEEK